MSGIKKITFKTIGITKADMQKACAKGPANVCLLAGILTRKSEDESQYGAYVDFHGEFRAVNMLTGEEFGSYRAILPGYPEEVLAAKFSGDEGSLPFKMIIGVSPSDKSPVGYEHTVELVEKGESAAQSLMDEFKDALGFDKEKAHKVK